MWWSGVWSLETEQITLEVLFDVPKMAKSEMLQVCGLDLPHPHSSHSPQLCFEQSYGITLCVVVL